MLDAGRALYVVPAKGVVTIGDTFVDTRDGAIIKSVDENADVVIAADLDAEIVVVDVPLT